MGEDREGSSSLLRLRPRYLCLRSTHIVPSNRLNAFQQEKSDLVARMESLINSTDDEHRDLTGDEENDYQELEAWLPALDRRVVREQTFLNAQASQQPIRDLNRDTREDAAARIGRVHDAWQDDPMCGYERPPDFLLEVIEAGQGATPPLNCSSWRRPVPMKPAATATRGGFFVPEGMAPQVLTVDPEFDPTGRPNPGSDEFHNLK